MKAVYFDYNATTPVEPSVLEQMLPWFTEHFGNASSKSHAYGWEAEFAVKQARKQLGELLNCSPEQLTFCSGATEAINLAIRGLAASWQHKKRHIITWKTEHKAVLDTLQQLEKNGFEITYLEVDANGQANIQQLRDNVNDKSLLVCGMLANNETGVIFPIRELAAVAHTAGAYFLCDITQAPGKIPIDVNALGADLIVGSAHKFYGPKGIGFLYLSSGRGAPKLQAQLTGGGHENGLRSGTLNVPGIVGLGAAARLAKENEAKWFEQLSQHQRDFEKLLLDHIPEAKIMGANTNRLPNTTNLFIAHCPAAALIKQLRGYALATGSACSSALASPSHVLTAYGLSDQEAACCLRISTGIHTTWEELESFAHVLSTLVSAEREQQPSWKYR